MGIIILGVTAVKSGFLVYSKFSSPWIISLSICTRRGTERGEGTLGVMHTIMVAVRVPLKKAHVTLSYIYRQRRGI
jgi:hypothetical protein